MSLRTNYMGMCPWGQLSIWECVLENKLHGNVSLRTIKYMGIYPWGQSPWEAMQSVGCWKNAIFTHTFAMSVIPEKGTRLPGKATVGILEVLCLKQHFIPEFFFKSETGVPPYIHIYFWIEPICVALTSLSPFLYMICHLLLSWASLCKTQSPFL